MEKAQNSVRFLADAAKKLLTCISEGVMLYSTSDQFVRDF